MTAQSTQGFAPLQGYTVLDLSQGVAGPYCAELLGHQGAKVIKVEPPEGDWARHVGVAQQGQSTLSTTYNAGKQSLAIDARHPQGKALVLKLARQADIVVQNFRPQAIARLGLDFASLSALGLQPVYVSISGYGASGPFADHPATDSVMQADSGLMATNRDAGHTPQRVGFLLADIATGVYAAQACTAALLQKARSGQGVHVEINLFNVCCALQSTVFSEQLLSGQPPRPAVSAPNGVFQTADGFLTILALNNDQFSRICLALDAPHWEADPRFASNELRLQHKEALHAELAALVRPRAMAELEATLQRHNALHARIRTAPDVTAHPQALHLGTFQPLEQPGFGPVYLATHPWQCHASPAAPAPAIGEHSRDILGALGLDAAAIDALVAEHIVAASPKGPPA
ncbi:MAG: CaiB/BaiF CoA transferase family protein [Comamonas sp.]